MEEEREKEDSPEGSDEKQLQDDMLIGHLSSLKELHLVAAYRAGDLETSGDHACCICALDTFMENKRRKDPTFRFLTITLDRDDRAYLHPMSKGAWNGSED